LVLLTAAALLLSACGHTSRTTGKERRLDDAIQACRATNQRVQLIGVGSADSQGGYTNIQDSSGQRQTTISDQAGTAGAWYRCVP
jgi:hypothetical protein